VHAAYLLTYRFKTRGREPSKSSGSYAALSWITNWIIDSLVPSLSMILNNDEQEYRCIDFSMKNLALYFCEHLRFDWRFSFKRFEIWGKMGIFYSFFFLKDSRCECEILDLPIAVYLCRWEYWGGMPTWSAWGVWSPRWSCRISLLSAVADAKFSHDWMYWLCCNDSH